MSNDCAGNGEIIKTYIIDDTPGLSGCSLSVDEILSCSLSGITINDDLLPPINGTISLGSTLRRFRDINTLSGTSTVWTSYDRVITQNLDLGLDSLGNQRTITADNSVIQNDILLGGTY